MTQIELIKAFLEGATEGVSSGGRNLNISGDKLIHFQTSIAEREDSKVIINMTRYSRVTGKLQKALCEMVTGDNQVIVKGVPEGYRESLINFVK